MNNIYAYQFPALLILSMKFITFGWKLKLVYNLALPWKKEIRGKRQNNKNKRPVGLYSPLLIQIIQYCNKCLHVDASKTGWTPNKKGNQRYTFTAVCLTYSLIVLSKRPFSLKQVARQSNWSVAIRDSVWLHTAHNKIYHTKETIL